MAGRKRSIADTVMVLADSLTGATLAALTPAQRAALTSEDTGAIIRLSIDFAQKVGGIIEKKGAIDG